MTLILRVKRIRKLNRTRLLQIHRALIILKVRSKPTTNWKKPSPKFSHLIPRSLRQQVKIRLKTVNQIHTLLKKGLLTRNLNHKAKRLKSKKIILMNFYQSVWPSSSGKASSRSRSKSLSNRSQSLILSNSSLSNLIVNLVVTTLT